MALARCALDFRGQRDPQLKSLGGPQGCPGMPYTAAGPHPFDPTCRNNSLDTGGLLILDGAFMNDGQRGDSRMGMPAKVRRARCGDVEEIQEHKRFDEFANIRRADQPRDGSVPAPSSPKHNRAAGDGCSQYRAHAAIAELSHRTLESIGS